MERVSIEEVSEALLDLRSRLVEALQSQPLPQSLLMAYNDRHGVELGLLRQESQFNGDVWLINNDLGQVALRLTRDGDIVS